MAASYYNASFDYDNALVADAHRRHHPKGGEPMTNLNHTIDGNPMPATPLDEALTRLAFTNPPSEQAYQAAHGACSGDADAELDERLAEHAHAQALRQQPDERPFLRTADALLSGVTRWRESGVAPDPVERERAEWDRLNEGDRFE